jgi:hypothetical protein
MGDFYGYRTGKISNDILSLEYLLDAGPRIVRLYFQGLNENILAEVPDRRHITKYGTFYFHGGHRLWHAPEDIVRTYIPDNDPVMVTQLPEGVLLAQSIEPHSGIQKSIQISLHSDSAKVTLHHSIKNTGLWPIQLSAWALTQFPLEGIAILPQTNEKLDPDGLLPNRNLSLWSYTKLDDPRLMLGDDFILINANALLPALKLGYTNRRGWMGYFRKTTLLIKHFTPYPDQPHPDFGCNVETYCGDSFIELETLSPYVLIHPGQSLTHTEIWEIIPILNPIVDMDDVRQLFGQFGIS